LMQQYTVYTVLYSFTHSSSGRCSDWQDKNEINTS
jgi:hypothetical protein